MPSSITPMLWFDTEAEEAARHYVSIFGDGRIHAVTHYTPGAPRPAGTVMTVDFEVRGQRLVALNGGPQFRFTEAISLVISCPTQEEVDRLWEELGKGGEEGQCGWIKDRYGLWWQVVPEGMGEAFGSGDPARAERVMAAMLKMRKLDVGELRRAAEAA